MMPSRALALLCMLAAGCDECGDDDEPGTDAGLSDGASPEPFEEIPPLLWVPPQTPEQEERRRCVAQAVAELSVPGTTRIGCPPVDITLVRTTSSVDYVTADGFNRPVVVASAAHAPRAEAQPAVQVLSCGAEAPRVESAYFDALDKGLSCLHGLSPDLGGEFAGNIVPRPIDIQCTDLMPPTPQSRMALAQINVTALPPHIWVDVPAIEASYGPAGLAQVLFHEILHLFIASDPADHNTRMPYDRITACERYCFEPPSDQTASLAACCKNELDCAHPDHVLGVAEFRVREHSRTESRERSLCDGATDPIELEHRVWFKCVTEWTLTGQGIEKRTRCASFREGRTASHTQFKCFDRAGVCRAEDSSILEKTSLECDDTRVLPGNQLGATVAFGSCSAVRTYTRDAKKTFRDCDGARRVQTTPFHEEVESSAGSNWQIDLARDGYSGSVTESISCGSGCQRETTRSWNFHPR